MVARLDDTGGCVEVDDVLVGCCVAKEDACEVVVVKFTAPCAHAFDTHTRTKRFKMCYVRLLSVPTFERSLVGSGMHESIMEIDGV
jgi:hypothetical protein